VSDGNLIDEVDCQQVPLPLSGASMEAVPALAVMAPARVLVSGPCSMRLFE